MRIGMACPHPDMPTGYANQAALIIKRLQAAGHDMAVFATAGQPNHPGWWQGVPVYPCTTYADFGEDVVAHHFRSHKADVVFTLMCTWILKFPQIWREMRTVHITPVDCAPMSFADCEVIENSGGTPAAISQFGLEQMRSGGHPGNERPRLQPLYLPHGIDTAVYSPAMDRQALRASMGYDGKWVVGMNFMNNDRQRKNIYQAMRGFAEFFHGNQEIGPHPDALLAIHALNALPDGFNLHRIARHLGIDQAIHWSPQYELVTGMIRPELLADWYRPLDVLVNIGNEGFGLPALEAQACAVPVILGAWSTGPELAGPGWLIPESESDPLWNEKHRADWRVARPAAVAAALARAYDDGPSPGRRAASRDNALTWSIDTIIHERWEPVLGELG